MACVLRVCSGASRPLTRLEFMDACAGTPTLPPPALARPLLPLYRRTRPVYKKTSTTFMTSLAAPTSRKLTRRVLRGRLSAQRCSLAIRVTVVVSLSRMKTFSHYGAVVSLGLWREIELTVKAIDRYFLLVATQPRCTVGQVQDAMWAKTHVINRPSGKNRSPAGRRTGGGGEGGGGLYS